MTDDIQDTALAPALSARGLVIGYRDGRRPAVEVATGIDVYLPQGSVTCLLGPNGAGKSTLLRTISGQQRPLAGEILVGGSPLEAMSLGEVARRMSVVYTDRTNAGALTVREAVGLGRQPYTGFFGRLSDGDRQIVDESIRAVGVEALARRHMATLSDGERQKAMIARALAQRTPVMILDEPTSFLDVASRLEIMELLRMLARDFNTAVLLSTHDVASALTVASRLWLMPGNRRLIAGTTDTLLADGSLPSLFAGRNVRFDAVAMDFRLGQ